MVNIINPQVLPRFLMEAETITHPTAYPLVCRWVGSLPPTKKTSCQVFLYQQTHIDMEETGHLVRCFTSQTR